MLYSFEGSKEGELPVVEVNFLFLLSLGVLSHGLDVVSLCCCIIHTLTYQGDVVTVLENDGSGWVRAASCGKEGYVPLSYVQLQ